MNLHVSNLSPETTRDEVLAAFKAHGHVSSVSLPGDAMKDGHRSGPHRGYGFVLMRDKVEAKAALKALDGKALHGLALSVRKARPMWTPTYQS